jgi:hypothetical protein
VVGDLVTTPNAELAYRILDHIDAVPEQWDQREWCGTAKCFAGWAVDLSGERPDDFGMVNGVHVAERAAQLLGFASTTAMDDYAIEVLGIEVDDNEEPSERFDLFCATNTREDLGHLVAEIFGSGPVA